MRPHWCGEGMRRDRCLGQPPSCPEGAERVGVTTAGHFEAPATIVKMHSDGRFDLRSKGPRGMPEPPLSLGQPPLGDHLAAERRVGNGDDRLVAPAVLSRQVDRPYAPLRPAHVGSQGGEFRPMRKTGELEIRASDSVRQSHALLKVLVRVLKPESPDFGDAKADQCQRAQILTQAQLRFVRCLDCDQQPVRRLSQRRQVPTLPGQVQPQDHQRDLKASAPLRRYGRAPLGGKRKLPLGLFQRSAGQFIGCHQSGEFRIDRSHVGRECSEKLARGSGLPA
jgi:hypothetical protein